ncbi:protein required for some forms of polarized growth, localized to sites of polarized growth [Scheffersomyces coipomensis]|uniref:protein required for some forms of polarized growth, localized to sites of polarized growth n=1 Tax=Scheffersomyces coipomensis TaxID=1788519 RepID=UPI00315CFF9D
MIDSETFKKNSPFKITHNDSASNYNLENTTTDLLKFQLQEQYRSKLSELRESRFPEHSNNDLSLLHTTILNDSFSSHLQSNLDKGHVTIGNDSSVSSLSMMSNTPPSDSSESFEIESFIDNTSNKQNYLNLKVLIENSIFDTNKINNNAIMSLSRLQQVKILIEEKKEKQQYLLAKTTISQQFIHEIILSQSNNELEETSNNQDDDELDSKLLSKVLKSTTSLQDQLLTVNLELESLTTQLNNHNMACLVLGYVEDVRLSSSTDLSQQQHQQQIPIVTDDLVTSSPDHTPLKSSMSLQTINPRSDSLYQSFDVLFSHIASIAAHRNVQLPNPPSTNDSIDSRIKWACNCIDKISQTNGHTPPLTSSSSIQTTPSKNVSFSHENSFFSNSSPKNATDKALLDYKTALTDLRFSYQYLTKEYEFSRDNSQKLIQEYRKKINQLEKEVSHSKSSTSHQLNNTNNPNNTNNISDSNSNIIQLKDKEISKLRRELNLLKIDKLGAKHANNSQFSLISSPKLVSDNLTTSVSPFTSELLSAPNHDEPEVEDQRSVNSGLSPSRPNSYGGMSSAILRKEFKKIISDMQDQYEGELSEEKFRRKQLQSEIDKLKRA